MKANVKVDVVLNVKPNVRFGVRMHLEVRPNVHRAVRLTVRRNLHLRFRRLVAVPLPLRHFLVSLITLITRIKMQAGDVVMALGSVGGNKGSHR